MVTKMEEIVDMGFHTGTLFQCPDCKTIKVFKNRTPECDCNEKTLKEYFGEDYKEVLSTQFH